jgi:hypothetical protein
MSASPDRLKSLAGCGDVASLRAAVSALCTEFGKVMRIDIFTMTGPEKTARAVLPAARIARPGEQAHGRPRRVALRRRRAGDRRSSAGGVSLPVARVTIFSRTMTTATSRSTWMKPPMVAEDMSPAATAGRG